MDVTALDIANALIRQSKKEDIVMTQLKLQRLLFILYKEYFKETEVSLFKEVFIVKGDDFFIPEIFIAFGCGRCNHVKDYFYYDGINYKLPNFKVDPYLCKVFSEVWANYKNYDALYLSHLIKLQSTAFHSAKKSRNKTLSNFDIFSEKSYI